MSAKQRRLSGRDVVGILRRFGFAVLSQRGSHVKLRRVTPNGQKQTLVIPMHADLDRGTQRAIQRQAARFVPEHELANYFRAP